MYFYIALYKKNVQNLLNKKIPQVLYKRKLISHCYPLIAFMERYFLLKFNFPNDNIEWTGVFLSKFNTFFTCSFLAVILWYNLAGCWQNVGNLLLQVSIIFSIKYWTFSCAIHVWLIIRLSILPWFTDLRKQIVTWHGIINGWSLCVTFAQWLGNGTDLVEYTIWCHLGCLSKCQNLDTSLYDTWCKQLQIILSPKCREFPYLLGELS